MPQSVSGVPLPKTLPEVEVAASGESLVALERSLTGTIALIRDLQETKTGGTPLNLVLSAATSIVASMGATCRISAPPVPIEVTTDNSGGLIYKCSHDPSHSWPA